MNAVIPDVYSLLKRQVKKHLRLAGEIPPEWRAFVQAVDSAYRQSDTDREMLERSLELSSQELFQANTELRAVHDELEMRVEERTAALARAQEHLRHAQKMEAIGTMAGGIAHDFNNILGAIIGYTELALMDAAGNQSVMKNLQAVMAASRRAIDLVKQILAFSRRQPRAREVVHVAPIVDEALKLLRASLPASIEIRAALDWDAPAVLADATEIHQVVMNLGTNAWHAMNKRGGVLEVTLSLFDADADFAALHINMRAGRYTVLAFSDTGHGMDRATQERIFDPFFTTKAPGEGTGLGLATVHGIVRNHDGAIAVRSQPGEGTVFHLYFPAVATAAGEDDEDVPSQAAPRGSGQHVLFVDDEVPLARWGQQVLERLGYRVTSCTNAFDALNAVNDTPAQFDLVVTDLTMPLMSGLTLTKSLLAVRPDLPVILTTGHTADLAEDTIHQFGFSELLMKPNTVQSLANAVHRALKARNRA